MSAFEWAKQFLVWQKPEGDEVFPVELSELTAVIRDAQIEAIEEIAEAFDAGTSSFNNVGTLRPYQVAERIRIMAQKRRTG